MGANPFRRRVVVWTKDDPAGMELAEIRLAPGRLRAEGVAIGSAPVPYRLDYALETARGYVTTRLRARSRGDRWSRTLDLRRGGDGAWVVEADERGAVDMPPPGGDARALAGALDCDLGLCPVTNAMPILRHGLLSGGTAELVVAWVSVPDLSVQPDVQRYMHVRVEGVSRVVRFEAVDGTFAADIALDADGIVFDYPSIARRAGG
jgi:hypothetical protein